VIVHSDCDTPGALVNVVENSFADVYFTPHWRLSLNSEYREPLSRIVNQFMSEIQVPAVEKHRAALEIAFGTKITANQNLPNDDHIPASLIPSQMSNTNLPTSPWRGQCTSPIATAQSTHFTALPAVGPGKPVTRFTTTTIPSFPMVEVPWHRRDAKSQTKPTATPAEVDINGPIRVTKAVGSRKPVTRFTTATIPSFPMVEVPWHSRDTKLETKLTATTIPADDVINGPIRITKADQLETLSPTSSYGESEWFSSSAVLSAVDEASAGIMRMHTDSPIASPTPSRASSPGSSASTRFRPTQFNPIIPPGPITEMWLFENGWAPQWGNVVRKVVEENTLSRWVPVLMEYEIDEMSAESLKHCVMKDYALAGSVSGSGPLGC